MHISAKT